MRLLQGQGILVAHNRVAGRAAARRPVSRKRWAHPAKRLAAGVAAPGVSRPHVPPPVASRHGRQLGAALGVQHCVLLWGVVLTPRTWDVGG